MFERTSNFQSYIAAARRYPGVWRLLLGILTAAVVYFVTNSIGFLGLATFGGNTISNNFGSRLAAGSDPTAMFILLATFIGMGVGAVCAALWHERGLLSLIGPFRRSLVDAGRTFSVTIPIYLIAGFVISLFLNETPIPQTSHVAWIGFMFLALPLLLIQTGSEELIFRGYLTQQLAARFQSAWIWVLIPTVLFGLAHLNLDFVPVVTFLVVFATGYFGLIALDLTRITGNLGAAIAFHFTNNFFALFIVAVPDQLSGLALYLAPFGMDDIDIIIPLMVADIIVLSVVWALLRRYLS